MIAGSTATRCRMNDRAVFLDRDGTVIVEVGYLSKPEQVQLVEGAPEALMKLRQAGFRLVVVSNQSGVARGYFTIEDVEAANSKMAELLMPHGIVFDAIYYCPHLDNCGCRKPDRGMVDRAVRELGVDPKKSFVVGDHLSDVGLALNAGSRGILVLTGHGADSFKELDQKPAFKPHHIAKDLSAAAEWIINAG